MLTHRIRLLQAIRKLAGIVLALFASSILHAQSATAPTTSEDPAGIDQAWQKASSKYDAERGAVFEVKKEIPDYNLPTCMEVYLCDVFCFYFYS